MQKKLFPLPGLEREEQRFRRLLAIAQPGDHILIKGQRGSGKTYFAQVYQEQTGRKVEQFNCANFPPDLVASQLFGHKKGAFTGATQDKTGIIEAAQESGKDIILEELNTLPPEGQANLLVFLETGRYHPVGSPTLKPARDVRVIATMNEEPTGRNSRLDLVDRFRIRVEVPPLYKRRGDIFHLIAGSREFQELELAVPELLALYAHAWPGNLRELDQVLFEYSAGLGLPEHILNPTADGLRKVYRAMQQAGLGEERIREIDAGLFQGKIPIAAAGSYFYGEELERYRLSSTSFAEEFQAPYGLFFDLLDWRGAEDSNRNLLDESAFRVPADFWGLAFHRLGGLAMPVALADDKAIRIPYFGEFHDLWRALFHAWPGEESPPAAAITKGQVMDFVMGLGSYQEVETFLLGEGLARMGGPEQRGSQKALAEHWGIKEQTLSRWLQKHGLVSPRKKTNPKNKN